MVLTILQNKESNKQNKQARRFSEVRQPAQKTQIHRARPKLLLIHQRELGL